MASSRTYTGLAYYDSQQLVTEMGLSACWLFRMNCDATDKVSIVVSGAQYVLPSWSEDSLFCIVGMENNG